MLNRPLVRAIAILAIIDYAGLLLTTLLGLAPAIVLALVPCAVGSWVMLLFCYPLCLGFLGAAWGAKGRRAGVFCEQMALGMMAGLHLVWAVCVAELLFL